MKDDFEIVDMRKRSMCDDLLDFGFYGKEKNYAVIYFIFAVFFAVVGYYSTSAIAQTMLLGMALLFTAGFFLLWIFSECYYEPIVLTVAGSILLLFIIIFLGGILLWVLTHFTDVTFDWYLAIAIGGIFVIVLSALRGRRRWCMY